MSSRLSVGTPPAGTASYLLLVVDPDAPGGEFTHRVLFDIPGATRELQARAALGGAGKNDFGNTGYGGPCPPRGRGVHHYVFTLYALDTPSLGLRAGASRGQITGGIDEDRPLDAAAAFGRRSLGEEASYCLRVAGVDRGAESLFEFCNDH